MASGYTHILYSSLFASRGAFTSIIIDEPTAVVAAAGLLGGMYPDTDIRSTSRQWSLVIVGLLSLWFLNPLYFLTLLVVIYYSKHRGGTHCILSGILYGMPFLVMSGYLGCVFFLLSYTTHLLLDDAYSISKRKASIKKGLIRHRLQYVFRLYAKQENLLPYMLSITTTSMGLLWNTTNIMTAISMMLSKE